MIQWIQSQDATFWWLFGSSAVFFMLMLVGTPVLAVKIPPDYFAKGKRQQSWSNLPAALRPIVKVGKNVLGAVLVIAGVAMLVLPGQGVFAILAGLMLLDFPGRRRLVRRIVSQPTVLRSINRLRKRYKRPPLVVEG